MRCTGSTRLARWILLLSMLLPAFATAETKLSVTGQLRVRAEGDKKDFDPAASPFQYNDLRTRLGIEAVVDRCTHVFVQLQDSRRMGGVTSSGEALSGTTTDGKNVDAHQAYLLIDRLGVDGLFLQAGRFEMEIGNGRVFGLNDWSNVGRAWEGAALGYGADPARVTGYALKRLEPSAKKGSRDFDIFGLNCRFSKPAVDVFGFYERNAELAPGAGDAADLNLLDRALLGLYHKRPYGPADIEMNAVYQTGTQAAAGPVRDQDISAYLATAEVGYAVWAPKKLRLALGIDYASGDSDPNDGCYGAYSGPYARVHRFRGYMDYFRDYRPEGLVDLMARGSMVPGTGWTLKADAHYFRTAAEYVDFEGEETSSIGFELDLMASTTRIAGVKIDAGASVFLPTDSFANEYWEANKLPGSDETDPGLWGYLMFTAGFGKELE
jgi:hypothetical protein